MPGHEPARHFSRQARAFTIYFRARARSARAQAEIPEMKEANTKPTGLEPSEDCSREAGG